MPKDKMPGRNQKGSTQEMRRRMCTGKRRYSTPGDALDAAMLAGVERQRQAYCCQLCGHWHLASTGGPGTPQ